jgi:hypothetical protein
MQKMNLSYDLRSKLALRLFSAVTAITTGAAVVHAQVMVTEIPALVDDAHCWAGDVNESGEALVSCAEPGQPKNHITFVWNIATRQATRVTPQGAVSWSCPHINDAGHVLCNSSAGAMLWSRTSGHVLLDANAQAFALNDLGEVLLFGSLGSGIRRADGSFAPLPSGSFAHSLNNLSQVPVFWGPDAPAVKETLLSPWVLWSPDRPLFSFPPPPGAKSWYVVDVNDAGQALAQGDALVDGALVTRAWRFDPGVGWAVLTHPAELVDAAGYGARINLLGQVAGVIQASPDTPWFERAFHWPTPDTPIDLGGHVDADTYAYGNNAAGHVVGVAYCANPCHWRAMIWNVAPPPPPTPTQLVDAIETVVETLLDNADLASSDAHSLTSKLDASTQAIERGDTRAARNLLLATANQVKALVRSKRLSVADGDALLAAIDAALASL